MKAELVARIGKLKKWQILGSVVGKSYYRWKDNIKNNPKTIECKSVDLNGRA